MSYTRQPCPIWLFTDLTGNILDDNYWAHFLSNTFPYIPQGVYTDAQGTARANPVQFSPGGTLPADLYFETDTVYRIEIRRGQTQADPLIYEINNFDAGSGDTPVPAVSLPIDNQITNPQFTEINFLSPLTITNIGVNEYDIAPGWVLELDSSLSSILTVTREALAGNASIAPNPPVPGNPSYVLKITVVSGVFGYIRLRQRLQGTPAIWANQAVSASFTARMSSNSGEFALEYIPSAGGGSVTILDGVISTAYDVFAGGQLLGVSTNPGSGESAYVDIRLTLPTSGEYRVTNLQIIGSPEAVAYPYAQTTPARQKDQMFHYYADSILLQPKTNLLTGWTFALNPWQYRSPVSSNVANNVYTADQTIIIQQAFVTSATANNVAVGRGTFANNYAFQITAVTAANKVCALQYIDPSTIRPYWGEALSLRIRASVTKTGANVTPITFKVRLMYKNGLPGVLAQTVPVSSWDNTDNAIPSVGGDTWVYINSVNDPTYTLSATATEFDFNGFQLPASLGDNMTLGVMFIMMNNMDIAGTADVINIERVSLVRNDFAIDANPETYDESLRKCQFYFEHSYDVSQTATGVGVVTNVGVRFNKNDYIENGGATSMKRRPFGSDFMQVKNKVPTMRFYAPDATTVDRVSIVLRDANGNVVLNRTNPAVSTGYTAFSASKTNFYYLPTVSAEVFAYGGINLQQYYVQTEFHYEADARLGL